MKQLTDNNPVKQETITTRCIEIVQGIIRKETTVKTTDRLVVDLHADSLDILEIVMGLEEEFDIEISDEEVDKLDTVLDYINFITLALKAK